MKLKETLIKAWDTLAMGAEKQGTTELYIRQIITYEEYIKRIEEAERDYNEKHRKRIT